MRNPRFARTGPVIFDKPHDRRLVGYGVINKILFREGRNDDQRHPGTERKSALIAAEGRFGSRFSARIIRRAQEIVRGLRFVDHRRHDVVVPAI